MSTKNLDNKIDTLESAVDQYASADTVISIGGYSFTPAKLMIAGGILSTFLGGLYGAFEVYKDYMDMKQKITEYVAPDLSEFKEKLSVIEKEMQSTRLSVQEGTNYSNEIKNDLKRDIRRVESVLENLERSTKSSLRDMDKTVTDMRRYNDQTVKEVNRELSQSQKETVAEIKNMRIEIDSKIKKALDNPLANQ